MSRVARLMGIEGRVDADNWAIPEKVPYLDRAAIRHRDIGILSEEDKPYADYISVIRYEFDFEADDGTLIYRRTTPLWEE